MECSIIPFSCPIPHLYAVCRLWQVRLAKMEHPWWEIGHHSVGLFAYFCPGLKNSIIRKV